MKRGKNDRNDAEAICEAAGRPGMRFVRVKSTAATEFGVIAAKGIRQIPPLLEAIAAETAIPSDAREMLALFGQEIDHLDTRIKAIEVKLIAMHKANPISRLLATIPGIGPLIALTLAIEVDPAAFKSGRHLAAWLGLALPRQQIP